MVTVILMNITLIHVYNPVLNDQVLLHHEPHVLVSLLQDLSFEAIVMTTLFGPPEKYLAHQVDLHRTYIIAYDQRII